MDTPSTGKGHDTGYLLTDGRNMSSMPRTMWAMPNPMTPLPIRPRILEPMPETIAPRPVTTQLVLVALMKAPPGKSMPKPGTG